MMIRNSLSVKAKQELSLRGCTGAQAKTGKTKAWSLLYRENQ